MGAPFSFTGNLTAPPDPGLPLVPVPFGMNGQFTSSSADVLTLIGSGNRVIDLSTVPSAGVQGLLIKVDIVSPTPNSTPLPVTVRFNGGDAAGQTEVSPGGFVAVGSPNPVVGITAAVVYYTSDVRVRVWTFS